MESWHARPSSSQPASIACWPSMALSALSAAAVCPSSPLTIAHDDQAAPDWHFPGPSSKYHQRERPRSHHVRNHSSTTPVGPNLSTERRALHRRTQSSNPVHAIDLVRSPLGRFHSHTGAGPTRSIASSSSSSSSNMAAVPTTPVKSQRPFSQQLRDSPFSDYFTDDGRSLDNTKAAQYAAPSPETQRLLVRLNKLQAQLMREDSQDETVDIVERKMGEIDSELTALHESQPLSRRIDMRDSGYIDNESEFLNHETPAAHGLGVDRTPESPLAKKDRNVAAENKKAQSGSFMLELQGVLESVKAANGELRRRHMDLRELNDEHILQIEEYEQEIEQLRSENEALKSDLGFDHSELLFLKLQIKALEVDVDGLADHKDHQYASEHMRQQTPRGRLQEDMDRWRRDWHDVDGRFKLRRSAYSGSYREHSVTTPLERAAASVEDFNAQTEQQEEGDWKLETVKKAHGRVQSITIRRLDSFSISENDETPAALEKPEIFDANSNIELVSKPDLKYSDQQTQTEELIEDDSASTVQNGDDYYDTYDTDDETSSIQYDYSIPSVPSVPSLAMDDNEDSVSECAITTSPSSPATSLPTSPMLKPVEHNNVKTAWQDLWEGLSNFAGMGEDPV
ncbi:Hypothetical protein R9X50_00620800 [Acrodontium crateriforme]|uniref:Uncharacterized protein n=1 Tax=Acrodontium crateriforme TaxID=150365 RepID=A0AAQ3RBG6_9PEZI|nr:Hypothetical protein R9X50_00620800 [Acrodontium crateriforme]